MIAEHIAMKKTAVSSIKRLVDYLTDEQNKKSRVAEIWAKNCIASPTNEDSEDEFLITDDEVLGAIADEMTITQLQNTRSKDDKTYHLVISFPPGEEPSLKVLQAVERAYCDALGFAEHQRLAVVHRDTDCLHLHLAINKIHPQKLTINTPAKDYYKLMQTSAQLEKDFVFTKTNHEARPGNPTITVSENKIEKAEHVSGNETLATWIKTNCAEKIAAATTWEELHRVCAENGLTAKLRNNGLVFQTVDSTGNNKKGKPQFIAVKASTVSREFSKAKFEKKLGAFIAPMAINLLQAEKRKEIPDAKNKKYTKTPPNAGLFAQYQQAFFAAKNDYAVAKKQLDDYNTNQRNAITEECKKIKDVNRGKNCYAIRKIADERRGLRMQELRAEMKSKRETVRAKYHVGGYLEWLQNQAKSGNFQDEALQALRKRAFSLVKKANFILGDRDEIERKIKQTQGKIDLLQKDMAALAGDKKLEKWELKELYKQRDDLCERLAEQEKRCDLAALEKRLADDSLSKSEAKEVKEKAKRLRGELAKIDTVTKQGTLIYRVGDEEIRDRRDEFVATQNINQDSAIMFLKMAQSRFGNKLNITGDEEFTDKMVAAAVAGKLNITFKDEALEARRQTLLAAETAAYRIDLAVPFADREKAKAIGARFDGEAKKWFVDRREVSDEKIEQWLPQITDKKEEKITPDWNTPKEENAKKLPEKPHDKNFSR